MERLTVPYEYGDGYRSKCAETCGECDGCWGLDEIVNRLGAYEDTGLPPEVCANYKTFEDECISKGVTFSRIVELMNADADEGVCRVPQRKD